MQMKRLAKAAVASLVAVAMGVGVTACGSPEAEVENTINEEVSAMKAVSSFDSDTAKQYFDMSEDDFSKYGVNATDVVAAFFKHYSYQVQGVTVSDDGNSAQATVEVTNADMNSAMSTAFSQALGSAFASALSGNTDAAESALVEAFLNALNQTDAPLSTNTVTIDYVKTDGKWAPEDATDLFTQLVLGGQNLSFTS